MDSSETSTGNSVLTRIAGGEAAAVDECLQRYGGLVWSLATRYCDSDGDAEDATQDIFIELWRTAERFDPGKAGEATYVAMIARRRLIDRRRRGRNAPATVGLGDSALQLASVEADVVGKAELSDEAAKAARCMQHLSEVQRKILTLSIHRGEAQSSIAAALEMPLGTVKTYARRGLMQLRQCMKRPLSTEASG